MCESLKVSTVSRTKKESDIATKRHGKIIVVQKQINRKKQLISIKREKKMRVVPFERKKDQVKRTK
jgi:hypothetical protein